MELRQFACLVLGVFPAGNKHVEAKVNHREILISSEKLSLSSDNNPLSQKKQVYWTKLFSVFFDWDIIWEDRDEVKKSFYWNLNYSAISY